MRGARGGETDRGQRVVKQIIVGLWRRGLSWWWRCMQQIVVGIVVKKIVVLVVVLVVK